MKKGMDRGGDGVVAALVSQTHKTAFLPVISAAEAPAHGRTPAYYTYVRQFCLNWRGKVTKLSAGSREAYIGVKCRFLFFSTWKRSRGKCPLTASDARDQIHRNFGPILYVLGLVQTHSWLVSPRTMNRLPSARGRGFCCDRFRSTDKAKALLVEMTTELKYTRIQRPGHFEHVRLTPLQTSRSSARGDVSCPDHLILLENTFFFFLNVNWSLPTHPSSLSAPAETHLAVHLFPHFVYFLLDI